MELWDIQVVRRVSQAEGGIEGVGGGGWEERMGEKKSHQSNSRPSDPSGWIGMLACQQNRSGKRGFRPSQALPPPMADQKELVRCHLRHTRNTPYTSSATLCDLYCEGKMDWNACRVAKTRNVELPPRLTAGWLLLIASRRRSRRGDGLIVVFRRSGRRPILIFLLTSSLTAMPYAVPVASLTAARVACRCCC